MIRFGAILMISFGTLFLLLLLLVAMISFGWGNNANIRIDINN
jgi:hypothetical protein